MRIMTHDQVGALHDLMREHDAESVMPTYLPHGIVEMTLYRDDDMTPCCVATISVAGTVRTRETVVVA